MLMLGYEPSSVQSRLFLSDYTRCAFTLGIEVEQFLREFNPMFRRGEEALKRFTTTLEPSINGHPQILLVNNSSLSFTEARVNPLGVMHKAEIIAPDESQQRIVNSCMLIVGHHDEVSYAQQHDFVATTRISPKIRQY